MPTVQQLAKSAAQHFTSGAREADGIGAITTLADDRPEWVQDMCRAAHDNGSILPDDWRYEFIRQSIDALAEYDNEDSAQDTATAPDIYTSELTAWLASSNGRVAYMDEAVTEYGATTGDKILSYAQHIERLEVFNQVVSFLMARAEDEGENEDGDGDGGAE